MRGHSPCDPVWDEGMTGAPSEYGGPSRLMKKPSPGVIYTGRGCYALFASALLLHVLAMGVRL